MLAFIRSLNDNFSMVKLSMNIRVRILVVVVSGKYLNMDYSDVIFSLFQYEDNELYMALSPG